ncbi:phytanoyl-CoA dioxygenase family protein [Novosphingobium sp.]|uniref:phytanoyl-CoA dioxygenase family protein n=1 Tax=Novosphingobium sp. TaxID=1874826 RepID=UPI003D0CF015
MSTMKLTQATATPVTSAPAPTPEAGNASSTAHCTTHLRPLTCAQASGSGSALAAPGTFKARIQATAPVLTAEQLATYERDGYLVIKNFFPKELAAQLRQEAYALLCGLDLSTHPLTRFTTSNSSKKGLSEAEAEAAEQNAKEAAPTKPQLHYFLESAVARGFLFEEGAFNEAGERIKAKELAINKLGHALHLDAPPFRDFTHTDTMARIIADLGFKDPVVLQSMLIFKQPDIGGKVDKHRDSTFLHTKPSTAVGFWFALEDCKKARDGYPGNGCLAFVPKSHKDGGNDRRFRRVGVIAESINNIPADQRKAVDPTALRGPDNSHTKLKFFGEDKTINTYPPEAWIEEEVPAGSLVVIHGDVCHMSSPNTSADSRYIYTFHVFDDEGTQYPSDNWLQSKDLFKHFYSEPTP